MSASFLFEWHHAADEVYVTGTFDNWGKTEKLDRVDGASHFAKLVSLPSATDKILYKFVVDGVWTTDHTAPVESDASGNRNNVLLEHNIAKGTHDKSRAEMAAAAAASTGIISGQGAGSSTAALAGAQPLEKDLADRSTTTTNTDTTAATEKVPGSFPDPTPADEAPNPVDAVAGADQTFSVNPIPASLGYGNPVTLAPGEPVPDPSTLTRNTVASTATYDKESYEQGGVGAGAAAAAMAAKDGDDSGMFRVPPVQKGMIPESSLPMGVEAPTAQPDSGPMIQSAGAGSSTAALAGAVPLEARGVPAIVEESQAEAHVSPEASALYETVENKNDVESELLDKVPRQEPTSTSEGAAGEEGKGWIAGGIAAGVAAISTAAAYAGVPQSVQDKIDGMNTASDTTAQQPTDTAEDVPKPVAESIAKAHADPEAAASEAAVDDKKAMESELLKQVSPTQEAGEPAPTATAEQSSVAPGAAGSSSPVVADSETMAAISQADAPAPAPLDPPMQTTPQIVEPTPTPAPAPTTTTATPATTAIAADKGKENVTPTPKSESAGASTTKVAPAAVSEALAAKKPASRDVSPFSKPDGTSAAKATPSTPSKSTPAAAASSTPAASSSTAGTPTAGDTPSSSKSGKRRSRMSGWFSEHFGKNKK